MKKWHFPRFFVFSIFFSIEQLIQFHTQEDRYVYSMTLPQLKEFL